MIKEIEQQFLLRYPKGFEDQIIKEMFDKFSDTKAVSLIKNELSKKEFEILLCENNINKLDVLSLKFISNTWITSRFDKIGYRNFLKVCDAKDVFYQMLFTSMYVDINAFDELSKFVKMYDLSYDNSKGACWPTLSSFMYYSNSKCYPIKPMSVKKLSKYLSLDIKYKPLPNLETYCLYNNHLNTMLKESTLCSTKEQLDGLLFMLIVKGEI